jgi:hypothetical protein
MINVGKYQNFEVIRMNENEIIIDSHDDVISQETKWELAIWGVFYEGCYAVMAVNNENDYKRFVIGVEDDGVLYFDLNNTINAYWTSDLIIALTKLMAYNNR